MSLLGEFGANFIYDAKQKKAVLWGKSEEGDEIEVELIRRNDDDSHDAVLKINGKEKVEFVLREDEVEYHQDSLRLKQPSVRIIVDPVAAAKFRGFTKGNVPTPDIPADSLP